MIIGMQGFFNFDATAPGGITNTTEIQQALNNICNVGMLRSPSETVIFGGVLIGTNAQLAVRGDGGLQAVNLVGTGCRFGIYCTGAQQWALEDGDVFTWGARVSIAQQAANMTPCLGGFGNNANGALTFQVLHSDLSTNPYVELQVSKEGGIFRLKGWINGVLKLNATNASVPQGVIGGGNTWGNASAWQSSSVILSDIYWAFNKEGKDGNIGPCFVRAVPRDIPSPDISYTDAQTVMNNRISWNLNTTSLTPYSTRNPVAQKPTAAFGTGTEGMKILALTAQTMGRANPSGSPVRVTSQILDDGGNPVAGKTQINSSAGYAQGSVRSTVDVSGVDTTKLRQYSFVSSSDTI